MPSIARGRTSDGRDHLREAGRAGLVHRHVDQRELQLRADAGEEVEAAAAAPWRRARCRWRRASGRARRGRAARSPRRRSPAGCRRARGRCSRPRRRPAPRRQRGSGSSLSVSVHSSSAATRAASASLTSAASVLVWASSCLLLLGRRLGDLRTERLLLGPLGLERRDRGAARGVGGERAVDHVVGEPALGLGGSDAVGLVAEDARVDHGAEAIGTRCDARTNR